MATNGKTAIVPPQNLEAEESVLGAMMVSESTIEPVMLDVRLQAEDFYRDRHRTIYEAIIRLNENADPVDVLTVSEALSQHGQLDEVGGRDVIASLAAKVPAPGQRQALRADRQAELADAAPGWRRQADPAVDRRA